MKKTRYEVVPATLDHAKELATCMRQPDRAEIWAAAHEYPHAAVLGSLAVSRDAWTGIADETLVCMFGVGSATICSSVGVPWLLATAELERHARPFLRRNRKVVKQMMNGYSLLRNYVDARNVTSIRWLEWMGFEVLPTETFGVEGRLFHPFEMRPRDV